MEGYLDLFSGIGGFALVFEQAGWKFDKHYFSEIDRYATKVYKKHFPAAVELGSVTGVNGKELGKIDLITFGFPCQDLSVAGKRAGLAGARSGLFFEATRLIRECQPSTFVFENVAGLLTSNEGKDFEVVLQEIADIGLYECEWQLLNTSWFLPQNRERVYFIGHIAGAGGGKVFPIGESSKEIFQEKHGENIISGVISTKSQGGQLQFDGSSVLVCSLPHGFNKGGFKKLPCLRACNSFDKNEVVLVNSNLRRFTEIECERLNGFPDNWTDGISSTQRYKCLGNAVTVNVVKEIAKRLNPHQ